MLERVADGVRAPETASPERIEVEAEAERGGRSRGRRAPRGSPSGWARSSGVEEVCRGREQARGAIYSRPEAVAENGVLRRVDYGGAAVAREGSEVERRRGCSLVPFRC